MYKKHRWLLLILSLAIGIGSILLCFDFSSISSDVISVVSISSALYLAAYAGIQASPELRKKLKEVDTVRKDKSQIYILNSYIKTALVLNVLAIIIACISQLVDGRIAHNYNCVHMNLCLHDLAEKSCLCSSSNCTDLWKITKAVTSFLGVSIFSANLIQMCFIGKFVINRIAFDK